MATYSITTFLHISQLPQNFCLDKEDFWNRDLLNLVLWKLELGEMICT